MKRLIEGKKSRNELAAHSSIKPPASLKEEQAYCKLWEPLKVCLANKHCQFIAELTTEPLSVIQSFLLIGSTFAKLCNIICLKLVFYHKPSLKPVED